MITGLFRKCVFAGSLLFLLAGLSFSQAEQASWTLGLSTGWTVKDKESRTIHELKGVYGPVWRYSGSSGWVLDTNVDSGVGFIHDDKNDAWFVGIGPSWALYLNNHPWLQFNFGSKASGLSESKFGQDNNRSDLDIGGHFQFHSHVGFALRALEGLEFKVRGEHISNAGLDSPNPGLDFVTVGLAYRF